MNHHNEWQRWAENVVDPSLPDIVPGQKLPGFDDAVKDPSTKKWKLKSRYGDLYGEHLGSDNMRWYTEDRKMRFVTVAKKIDGVRIKGIVDEMLTSDEPIDAPRNLETASNVELPDQQSQEAQYAAMLGKDIDEIRTMMTSDMRGLMTLLRVANKRK